ncbi:hypothetical protein LLS47_12330 [Rouxiella badensis]|uniref:hypothetical protein n=1 Tax=Rouxiella badensis TaxID=1646377 RepID=UPI001D13EFFA|nr:hypothetical protein [Rouxiella badensis]MCC3733715.1 hypothetical protein [Rouxiella badensis]MCC3759632.1 hypothetical protein [Rouxiella badensis]
MMDILIKLLSIAGWFAAVVIAAIAYIGMIIFLLKKKVIGDAGAKAFYFGGFVIAAAFVYRLSVF